MPGVMGAAGGRCELRWKLHIRQLPWECGTSSGWVSAVWDTGPALHVPEPHTIL